MTQEQSAKKLVDKTFQKLCFEKNSFSAEDVRQECLRVINEQLDKVEFITHIIAE